MIVDPSAGLAAGGTAGAPGPDGDGMGPGAGPVMPDPSAGFEATDGPVPGAAGPAVVAALAPITTVTSPDSSTAGADLTCASVSATRSGSLPSGLDRSNNPQATAILRLPTPMKPPTSSSSAAGRPSLPIITSITRPTWLFSTPRTLRSSRPPSLRLAVSSRNADCGGTSFCGGCSTMSCAIASARSPASCGGMASPTGCPAAWTAGRLVAVAGTG